VRVPLRGDRSFLGWLPWLAGWALAFLTAGQALAAEDCAVPSDEVTRAVMVRLSPSTTSSIQGRLEPGSAAQILGEVPYWYRVRLPDGKVGYASKRWTDLSECAAPLEAAPARFELHAIDVGTGLSILVRGPDFALLYDAGSNDDLATGDRNRVLAYLGQFTDLHTLDHLVLSHPHRDHVELMADLMGKYEVKDVWNSGAFNDICGYRAWLEAIAAEPGVRYHTALANYGEEHLELAARCHEDARDLILVHGARIDANPIVLGRDATMRFLYVDGSDHSDLNDNSLVLQLTLGSHTVLLMGDAGGGSRQDPSSPPAPDSIEGALLACCRDELKADVLVVGHHGSKTSSRTVFLDAVAAPVYVVSSGPTKYSGTTLPDAEVITQLSQRGQVWRTDVDDSACRSSQTKVGPHDDGRPGGCSNVFISVSPAGVSAAYAPEP
jgi:competence protein ComEC